MASSVVFLLNEKDNRCIVITHTERTGFKCDLDDVLYHV